MEKTVYVGLDVHADTIAVALADEGRGGDMRFYGTIANSGDAVLRLTKTLSRDGHPRLIFCCIGLLFSVEFFPNMHAPFLAGVGEP